MKCPQCESQDLVMTDRQGIEIDYCPKCRGVWLDRGELDKIIERSASFDRPSGPERSQGFDRPVGYDSRPVSRRDDDDDDDDDDRRRYERQQGQGYPPQGHGHPPQQHYQKRKSFWSELFD